MENLFLDRCCILDLETIANRRCAENAVLCGFEVQIWTLNEAWPLGRNQRTTTASSRRRIALNRAFLVEAQ